MTTIQQTVVEVDGRRYEISSLLTEVKNIVSGDKTLHHAIGVNDGAIGNEDFDFLRGKRINRLQAPLMDFRKYFLVTGRRCAGFPKYVEYFHWEAPSFDWNNGRWAIGWGCLASLPLDRVLLIRRCP